jgi:opacity protein-like surface antigen
MKKFGLSALAVLALMAQSEVQAQGTDNAFSLGFKISPNFSWLKVQDGAIENENMGLGFSYGLTGDYKLGNTGNYWATADLMVTTAPVNLLHKGTLIRENNKNKLINDTLNGVTLGYRVQYLQIPLCLKFKTENIGGLYYTFQVGLSPSFMISKRLTTTSDPSVYDGTNYDSHNPNSSDATETGFEFNGGTGRDNELMFSDDISTARMGMVLGAGIEYPMSGNLRMTAGVRFDNGIGDFLKDNAYTGRHNFLSIQLGLMF